MPAARACRARKRKNGSVRGSDTCRREPRLRIPLDAGGWVIHHPGPMNPIQFTSTLCAAIMALHGAAFAGGEGWLSDFAAAKKQAAESKKDLLLDFTGSDWCGWCIKLNDEVFKQSRSRPA